MRKEIIHFLENTKDESVIAFIFRNLTKSGVEEIFDYLEFCTDETRELWQSHYMKLFEY